MIIAFHNFKGGVGKKGKAGLIGKARDLKTALAERERLYFVQHTHGNVTAKAQGVTFEAAVPAEHEVYFSISDSTRFRAPTVTITHHGGMDIEEVAHHHPEKILREAIDPGFGMRPFQARVMTPEQMDEVRVQFRAPPSTIWSRAPRSCAPGCWCSRYVERPATSGPNMRWPSG